MKTSELSIAALDWAVAKAEGFEVKWDAERKMLLSSIGFFVYAPSADWSVGGAIIEREKISIEATRDHLWTATIWNGTNPQFYTATGNTPLIAAMRCYVASKLGHEVQLPEGI